MIRLGLAAILLWPQVTVHETFKVWRITTRDFMSGTPVVVLSNLLPTYELFKSNQDSCQTSQVPTETNNTMLSNDTGACQHMKVVFKSTEAPSYPRGLPRPYSERFNIPSQWSYYPKICNTVQSTERSDQSLGQHPWKESRAWLLALEQPGLFFRRCPCSWKSSGILSSCISWKGRCRRIAIREGKAKLREQLLWIYRKADSLTFTTYLT
jgi:hypothetical protein